MTEIPEHLLKRSKSAKSGKTGGDADDAPAAASTSVTPAAATAPAAGQPAALAKAAAAIGPDKAPPPAKPVPAYIAAAERRKKMPIWAMGLVAALPIWAWIYAGTMQPRDVEDLLFVDAALVYGEVGGCAGCHGAGGGGGTGYAFADGEIVRTFPEPIDQMVHIARGSAAIAGEQYGDPEREGGAHIAGARGVMPAFAAGLTLEQLELVVFHERVVLGGESTESESYVLWEELLREKIESGAATPIDDEHFELLLACANPEYTPGATGDAEEPEKCPGPPAVEGEEAALEG